MVLFQQKVEELFRLNTDVQRDSCKRAAPTYSSAEQEVFAKLLDLLDYVPARGILFIGLRSF